MAVSPNDALREAREHPAARVLARAGYAANGVVHGLMGAIIIAVAAGDDAESDHSGAFRAIADVPLGFVLLWVLAAALAALGLWHGSSALLVRGKDRAATWGMQLSEAGQAIAFLVLGVLSAMVALGARPRGEQTAQDASRGVLTLPAGPWLLGAAGVAVGAAGVTFIVIGVRRGFRKVMTIPDGAVGRTVTVLGVVGYTAKGLSLVAVGILLIVAAVTVDPEAAGGLDAGVKALRGMLLGPLLVGFIGAGLIAYAVFCGARTRYAKLDRPMRPSSSGRH